MRAKSGRVVEGKNGGPIDEGLSLSKVNRYLTYLRVDPRDLAMMDWSWRDRRAVIG